jgi:hypothetical protein
MPYRLDPQVAGELGAGTVLDSSTHPPAVSHVDLTLDYPDADELIQSFPVFLVSESLGSRLQAADLTGFSLTGASVRPSENYLAVYGAAPHPHYLWMQVTGVAGTADCWLGDSLQVCVSDRMMEILEAVALSDCSVEELPS